MVRFSVIQRTNGTKNPSFTLNTSCKEGLSHTPTDSISNMILYMKYTQNLFLKKAASMRFKMRWMGLLPIVLCLIFQMAFPGFLVGEEEKAVYIPKDLAEAHRELEKIIPPDTIEKMKESEEQDISLYHLDVGMWMRNNWGLWKGSRLSNYFNNMGVLHPDDMSGIILDSFWYKLKQKPFPLQLRVQYYKEYWKAVVPPKVGSPKDGAKVAWVISWHSPKMIVGIMNHDPESLKGTVHLGISLSDHSFWRYEYGTGREIEPAKPDEAEQLAEWLADWKKKGNDLSGFAE